MKQIPLFKVFMHPDVSNILNPVLHCGFIGEGPKVREFESMLAQRIGTPQLLTMNSGTAALQIAYHIAIDHTPDAEIITTPVTCTATNTPIITNNAKIVWADVDPVSGNIDPNDIAKKITSKTKAIVIVHWGGNPCDIAKINTIAKDNNLVVVEDGAHAFGTQYKGRPIGLDSDFCMHSFQAIKHLTTGDGGLLIAKKQEDYDRAKLLRWYGIDRDAKTKEASDLRCEMDVVEAGYKAHMNDISATIGIANLDSIDWILERHRDNALFYDNAFQDSEGITIARNNPDGMSAYWLYTIHVRKRDAFMQRMMENGIAVSKVHSRNDTHSMFRSFKGGTLPGVNSFSETHVCIPVGWWVTQEDREYIAQKAIDIVKSLD